VLKRTSACLNLVDSTWSVRLQASTDAGEIRRAWTGRMTWKAQVGFLYGASQSKRRRQLCGGRPRDTLLPVGLPWPPEFSIPANPSVVSRVTIVDEDGGSLSMKGLLRHHERSSSPLKFPKPNMQQLFTPSRRTWLL
jgi:hypothetical protein